MHKKDVLDVAQVTLSVTEKQYCTNSALGASSVSARLSGKHALTNSANRSQQWFKLWITESCSIRLLRKLSGYSTFKLNGIKNYWLNQSPPARFDYAMVRYMIYDATYFHKDGCLLNLMDATNQKIIDHLYVRKGSFAEAYPWFMSMKEQGLSPQFIITDGERLILRAIQLVWPQAKLQRCLYHLQHEGMRWLRTYPKTQAGKTLRDILSRLSWIKTTDERDAFLKEYRYWVDQYRDYVWYCYFNNKVV